MRVAIVGAQSTGKTTLLNALKLEPSLLGFNFVEEVTRTVAKKGLKINEEGNDYTQVCIINLHLENLKHENAIYDRCILDGVVYTHYLYDKGQVSCDTLTYAYKQFITHINDYDKIFLLMPEFEMVDDKVRSVNREFRDEILNLFKLYITDHNLDVIELSGSVEERKQQFLENL